MHEAKCSAKSRSLQEWMTEFRQDEKAMKCLKITLIAVSVIGAIGVLVGITGTLSLFGGASFATVPLQVLNGTLPMPLNVVMAYTGGIGAVILIAVGTVPLAICVLGEKKAEEGSEEVLESEEHWEIDPNTYSLSTMNVATRKDENTLTFEALDREAVEEYIEKNENGHLEEVLSELKLFFVYKDDANQMHFHYPFHRKLRSQTQLFNVPVSVYFARQMKCEYMISDFNQLKNLVEQKRQGFSYNPKKPDLFKFPDIIAAIVKIPPVAS